MSDEKGKKRERKPTGHVEEGLLLVTERRFKGFKLFLSSLFYIINLSAFAVLFLDPSKIGASALPHHPKETRLTKRARLLVNGALHTHKAASSFWMLVPHMSITTHWGMGLDRVGVTASSSAAFEISHFFHTPFPFLIRFLPLNPPPALSVSSFLL